MRTQVMHEHVVATPWLDHSTCDEPNDKTFLDSFPFKIGRKETSDLCIDSTNVSREHAVITRLGTKYHIHDLGSTNGTFLNGQRIQEAALSNGDQLMIGEVELTFYSAEPSADRETATQVIRPAAAGDSDAVWRTILAVRRIHEVVTCRGLRIVYQPIVELDTGNTFGYEALASSGAGENAQARWEQWSNGVECRAADRLRKLGRRMAAEQAVPLPGRRLLVALAAVECDGPSVVTGLRQLRELVGDDHKLVVEIPENAVCDSEAFRELRSALRDEHIEVAYDAYASGKAHIGEQKDVAPDYLKLASSLLRSIKRGHDRERQVQLMVNTSHDLGITVIASGVDSETDLEICHRLKCSLLQGDLFGRPQPVSALTHTSRAQCLVTSSTG